MLGNQKGDALTLAMGAAVFVGISVMVVIAILGNMDSQVNRTRIVNDTESVVLFINQLLNNRDLCTYALRQHNGQGILIRDPNNTANNLPLAANPIVPKTRIPVPRLYLTNPLAYNQVPTATPRLCSSTSSGADGVAIPNADPNCPTFNNVIIRNINFAFHNDTNNHKPLFYNGESDRYYLITGDLEIDFDFPAKQVLGGDLKTRKFPFSILYDRVGAPTGKWGQPTPNGEIEMCYTKESPALICAQLGGSLNPGSGVCENMFGNCADPALQPAACSAFPGANCPAGAGLIWTTIYYPATVLPGMQMTCNCMVVCTFPPP